MNDLQELFHQANQHRILSNQYLDEFVQEIARQKGFSEDQVKKFGASWVGGSGESVVTYNGCAEQSDLDARFMEGYTKEEIIKRLSETEVNLFED